MTVPLAITSCHERGLSSHEIAASADVQIARSGLGEVELEIQAMGVESLHRPRGESLAAGRVAQPVARQAGHAARHARVAGASGRGDLVDAFGDFGQHAAERVLHPFLAEAGRQAGQGDQGEWRLREDILLRSLEVGQRRLDRARDPQELGVDALPALGCAVLPGGRTAPARRRLLDTGFAGLLLQLPKLRLLPDELVVLVARSTAFVSFS